MSWLEDRIRTLDRRYLKGRLFVCRHCGSWQQCRHLIKMSRRPILLGGCGRSGTTLLLSVLSAHPNVYAIPGETGAFCPTAYFETPDYDADFRVEKLYRKLLEGSPGGRGRWCEKTPKNVRFIGRILDYFGGGARFIHVVRDGRDVVTSVHPEAPSRYWIAPERWLEDVAAGRCFEGHPQVMTARYEDLVSDFRPTLRSICDFLGEPFDRALAEYPGSAAIKSDEAWFGEATSVHRQSIGRWRDARHAEVVERLCGLPGAVELLRHYRYAEE